LKEGEAVMSNSPAEPVAAEQPEVTALAWLAAGHNSPPAETLRRIEAMCRLQPDLFRALAMISATHPGIAPERLAAAVRTFRPDTAAFSEKDVAGLITAVRTSSREAFDAVLRTRAKTAKASAGRPAWLGAE
jgi:hypothetical protein